MKTTTLFFQVTILFFLTLWVGKGLVAQTSSSSDLKLINKNKWVEVNPNSHYSSVVFFTELSKLLSSNIPLKMEFLEEKKDELGYTHRKFQQYHQNIPVEGAEYILHEKDGGIVRANGTLVPNITIQVMPTLTSKEALVVAQTHLPSEKYGWDSNDLEQKLKYSSENEEATFLPSPQLVIADKNYSQNPNDYSLCWKMEIYSVDPLFYKQVFINAHTGELEYSYDLLHSASGIAVTKYSGQQNIITDSIAPDTFLLRDYTRGKGIETFDMNTKTDNDSAVDFLDDDNFWNNFNAEEDEAATDAHWGTEMTYDYFVQNHNHYSYDNDTSKLISYVHYDLNYVNAFWNGKWATYGDGNGSSYSPLTPIDVVAHEITHGVTGNSAKLIYQNESGALNESFSDIFGASVEKFAIPDSFDWYLGEDSHITGNGFRNMSNPNEMGDPDTYFGTNWYTGSQDNGGVHTNSGVQNFWFYLLSEGGTGINDIGDNYNVSALGMEVAAAIAYRNLTVYLTSSSNYFDARHGAIFAAEDLYGKCSNEAIQVANAWHAVGVGPPLSDYDMWVFDAVTPNTQCGLSASEPLEIKIRYNGCGVTLNSGDKIPLAYSLNNGPTVYDTLTLTGSLAGGDTIGFTFNQTLDLSTVGVHEIDVWSEMPGDTVQYNDTVVDYTIEHILQQNTDVGILRVMSPTSNCDMGSTEEIMIEMGFYGCDSLASGAQFDVAYTFNNGSPVQETVTLANNIFPGDTIFYTFVNTIDVSVLGQYPFSVWTDFTGDVDNSNDSVNDILLQNPISLHEEIVQFEDSVNVRDTLIIENTENTIARVSSTFPNTGTYGFQITGIGDVRDNYPNFKVPSKNSTWNRYPEYKSQLCFCVDGSLWETAELVFDLRQTYAATHQLVLGSGNNSKYGSSMRVLGNDIEMSGLYNPAHFFSDTFQTHTLNFDTLAGTEFELCFETRTYFNIKDEDVPYGKGDNVFLDNIFFNFVLGQEEYNNNLLFDLYPNPANNELNVSYNSIVSGVLEVKVVDVLGKQVSIERSAVVKGSNVLKINTQQLQSGVYLLQLTTEKGGIAKPFVIKK